MKKKLIVVSLLLLAVIITHAQSYNPYVGQAIISPAPLLPLEFNGTGIASFNIGNTFASDMLLVPDKANTLKITLAKGEPDNADPVAAVGGTWKDYFDWSYNSGTKTYTAIQNQTLPGAPVVGNITIAYKVTENSNFSTVNNGFNVNIQPNPDYNGIGGNNTDDDGAASYTYVKAWDYSDAPASYTAIYHEIDVNKTSGIYDNYVYMGTGVTADGSSVLAVPGTLNSANADADTDNGVTFPKLLIGTTVTIPVTVTIHDYNFDTNPVAVQLRGWIDWDKSGAFATTLERVANIDVPLQLLLENNEQSWTGARSFVINVSVPIPGTQTAGYYFSRWRVGEVVGPTTSSTFGEVEDYRILLENDVCAWKTIAAGNWIDPAIWQYFDCGTNTWKTTTVAPNNDRPIYVSHAVTIGTTDVITADSLYIQPSGQLNACGSLTIDNEIAFVLDANGNPGELNNCGCPGGTVELNPTARKIVHRPAGSAWSFMSFPFNVLEQNIFLSGAKVYNVADVNDNFSYTKTTQATWGNLTDIGKDFYAVEYDGQKQATDNAAGTSSSNFVNVIGTAGSRVLEAMKGYLIANSKNNLQAIDFTSALGEDFNFCNDVTKSLTFYTATGAASCSEGWNFVGLPYVSSYDLINATSISGVKYVYNAPDYETVVSGDNNIVYPLSAYFVKVPSTQDLLYTTTGQQLIKGVSRSVNMDEISLVLMYGNNEDRTRIRLQEDAVNNFIYTEDAYKMMSGSATFPQIYTQIEGECANIDVNTLPKNTEQVQLIIRTGLKGLYTVRLTDAQRIAGVSKVILVDRETGLRTDLMANESYTFEVTETGTSDRFYVLFSNDGTTGIIPGNNDISIITKGKNLSFHGLKGIAHVNMYDVVGKLIYQYPDIADNQSFDVDIPGVYMIDISTATQKARIKVLINNND